MSRLRICLFVVLASGVIPYMPQNAVGRIGEEPAKIKVYLPADAVLHVDGAQTQATGEIRNFLSPPLPPGRKFIYTLRATWKEGGKEVDREQKIRVEAGLETTVDFRSSMTIVEEPDRSARELVPDLVMRMLELAGVKKGDVVCDPKCGDGRVLIAAAQKFAAKGIGFEIDVQRADEAIENVKKSGLSDLVSIKKQSTTEADLKDVSVVALHGSAEWNVKLMPILAKLGPGSRIVSADFDMKGAKPAKKVPFIVKGAKPGEDKEHSLFLWIVPWDKE